MLDDLGFDGRSKKFFFRAFRLYPGPTELDIHYVSGALSLGTKVAGA
jgi:hypothetical protein